VESKISSIARFIHYQYNYYSLHWSWLAIMMVKFWSLEVMVACIEHESFVPHMQKIFVVNRNSIFCSHRFKSSLIVPIVFKLFSTTRKLYSHVTCFSAATARQSFVIVTPLVMNWPAYNVLVFCAHHVQSFFILFHSC